MHLFASQGYDGTTNRAIAEAGGLSGAAIYHYFDSKAELYAAVYEAVFDRVFAELDRAVAVPVHARRAVRRPARGDRSDEPRGPDRSRRSSSASPATPSATRSCRR